MNITPEMRRCQGQPSELYIWAGGWGLPSVDPVCLQAAASVRFSGSSKTTIVETNNPWISPRGSFPTFKIKNHYLYQPNDISAFLRTGHDTCDYGMSARQFSEGRAYVEFVCESLEPAYQYFFWLEDSNYTEISRPMYGRRVPWYYKIWYPVNQRRTASSLIYIHYRQIECMELVEVIILAKARNCFRNLSQKLGNDPYFFGQRKPTSFDAIVFSYLALFLRVPLINNRLRGALLPFRNLENYVTRILIEFFPLSIRRPWNDPSCDYDEDGQLLDPDEPIRQRSIQHKAVTLGVSVTLMLAYAYIQGMFKK